METGRLLIKVRPISEPITKSFVSSKTGRAKKANLQQTEYTWRRARNTNSTNRCAVRFCVLAGVLQCKGSNRGTKKKREKSGFPYTFPTENMIFGRRPAARQVQANHLSFALFNCINFSYWYLSLR